MFEAQEAWIKTFGHAPGWGHWLKWEFPERWTRFHALPLSKQYPDTPEEMTTIVERANTLAEECMGGSTCVSLIMLDEECDRNLCNANQSLDWHTLLTWTDESDPPEERFE